QESALPAELVLIVVAAVVVAPVLEELLFRGVTQRWAARRPWGGLATMAGALLVSLFFSLERMGRALKPSAGPLEVPALLQAFATFAPSLFVLAMFPGFLWVCRKARTPFGPALYGTSLFFATMHSSVWPSPVALFVLALGLGW